VRLGQAGAGTLRAHENKRGGMSSVGDALGQFLRASGLERRMGEQRALAAWSTAVGPERAKRARAVRCRDGELLVEVDSAALLQELKNFTGEGLRRAANQLLGGEPIRRVSFQPRR
jgi:hypothetical protein